MRSVTSALVAALTLGAAGCGGSGSESNPLENVSALIILQRAPRMGGVGDVFQYTSYEPGARLVKLQPPTADGTVSPICCDQFPELAALDIQSYDLSFDAKSIVFSGRAGEGERYGLFVLNLNDANEAAGAPIALATDPMRDYVYPIFAAEDRIIFVTNSVVEPGAPQHQDEYERGTTTQLGSIGVDGSDEILGPRNLSHRVAPSMMQDGHVLFTQWDHLGDENSGHLMMTNPDFTNLREVYGKEGTGVTNSYLKAVEIDPGRVVTIATDRSRTLQSGKIVMASLGKMEDGQFRQSESRASFVDLTPLVPSDNAPSQFTVGRYYDAYPVKDGDGQFGDRPFFVVSWADGPVEEESLASASGVNADFGVYLFDSTKGKRHPVFNDPAKWDVFARPLAPRPAPAAIPASGTNEFSADSLLIGSLDVSVTSLDNIRFDRADAVAVRILEGFSVEEGVPDDFGLTEHEGASLLGEAPVYGDGSWAALIPANTPVHLQPIDKFGVALASEPVWFSGRPGESRLCGGCHEDRARTSSVSPGVTQAISAGPEAFDIPRAARRSTTFTRADVKGVPWDQALQPIFDRACVSCHDGDASKPGNRSLTFTETATGLSQTFTFNLSGAEVSYGAGAELISGYTASHLSLLGPMMMDLEDAGIELSGDMPIYVEPGNARESELTRVLNPPQLYPALDRTVRFRDGLSHLEEVGAEDVLTEDEYYLLNLMMDAGGQFYSRENAPGESGY